MRFSNYHTHTALCDGTMLPLDYCAEAERLGFESLGFSAHGPVPVPSTWNIPAGRVPEYLRLVGEAKEAYAGRLEVFLGMEADFIDGIAAPDDDRIAAYPLDYVIGSVHYVRSPAGRLFTVDEGAESVGRCLAGDYAGDGMRIAADYYRALGLMLERCRIDILGHLDLVKKNNAALGLFDESAPAYRKLVRGILPAVQKNGCIVEVNTGGMARGKIDTPYPSPWLLRELCELGIPVVIDSDAHRPEHLAFAYPEMVHLLREVGYRSVMRLESGGWREAPLDEA